MTLTEQPFLLRVWVAICAFIRSWVGDIHNPDDEDDPGRNL
jgi:hypothetical protein